MSVPSCSPEAGPAPQRQLCLVGTAAVAKCRFTTQTQNRHVFALPKFPSTTPSAGDAPSTKRFFAEIAPCSSQGSYTRHRPCFSPAISFCLTPNKGPEEEKSLKHQNFSAQFSSLWLAYTLNLLKINQSVFKLL